MSLTYINHLLQLFLLRIHPSQPQLLPLAEVISVETEESHASLDR